MCKDCEKETGAANQANTVSTLDREMRAARAGGAVGLGYQPATRPAPQSAGAVSPLPARNLQDAIDRGSDGNGQLLELVERLSCVVARLGGAIPLPGTDVTGDMDSQLRMLHTTMDARDAYLVQLRHLVSRLEEL